MEQEKMKNMVVLKNLPSNLVEEAFVVLKDKAVAKQLQYIAQRKEEEKKEEKSSKKYMIKEAEMVISNYLKELENSKKQNSYNKLKKKYQNVKIVNILLVLIGMLAIII